jgi:hypothetical protein
MRWQPFRVTQTQPPQYVDVRIDGPKRANGLGITSVILGVLALVGSFIPFVNFGTGFIAFLGLVFGIIGLFMKHRSKTSAIVGSILSLIALILSIVLAVTYTASFAGAVSKNIDQASRAAARQVPVVYTVTGKGKDVSINYEQGDDGMEEANSTQLPWKKSFKGTVGGDFDYKIYNLTATNGADDKGKVTCSITIDGKVAVTKTSKGAFASANCDASGFKDN